MKIKFIKSPTGRFKLAYNIGSIGEVEIGLAKKCIAAGYAEEIKEVKEIKKFTKKTK
tara:strand:- start:744 stop:914 length:171 start_codon:yes stop_codon:yes gene_type:complete